LVLFTGEYLQDTEKYQKPTEKYQKLTEKCQKPTEKYQKLGGIHKSGYGGFHKLPRGASQIFWEAI
jgi:hypothetical protein